MTKISLFPFAVFVCLVMLNSELHAQMAKQLKKPKVAFLPLINYNKSYGGIFGAFGSLYFPLSKRDTISPASNAGGGGIITTNKTWFAFGFSKLYFNKDRYRTVVAGGTGNQNFQYYNYNFGTSVINYSTLLKFFFTEQLVRVYKRIYTGIDYTYFNVATTFEGGSSDTSRRAYVALGIPVTFDTRNNVQNATKGWFANAKVNRFDKALGSATEYTKLDVDVTNYRSKEKERVMAYKVSVSTALGNVPFEAQTIVGGNVLRGYSKGEYRGDQVYALNGEYRWNFYQKWGAVFFAGVATPVNKGEAWSPGDILPGGGAGIRYMMIPDIRLNVGFDAAVGKDDYGLYFRIGEAF